MPGGANFVNRNVSSSRTISWRRPAGDIGTISPPSNSNWSYSVKKPAAAKRSISATVQHQRGSPSAACVVGRCGGRVKRSFIGAPYHNDDKPSHQVPVPDTLSLEPIARLENPPHHREADGEEYRRHAQADAHADVGDAVKAPAEAADQINHRIDESDRLPNRRQHLDGVEAAAKEAQRGDDEERHHLELFEPVRPNTDDETEQAERCRGQQEKPQHPEGMVEP